MEITLAILGVICAIVAMIYSFVTASTVKSINRNRENVPLPHRRQVLTRIQISIAAATVAGIAQALEGHIEMVVIWVLFLAVQAVNWSSVQSSLRPVDSSDVKP